MIDAGDCGQVHDGYISENAQFMIVDGEKLPLKHFLTLDENLNDKTKDTMSWVYGFNWAFKYDEHSCKRLYRNRIDSVRQLLSIRRQSNLKEKKLLKYLRQEYPVKGVADDTVSFVRKKYLGEDRYFNRYWYFVCSGSDPYKASNIFVELSFLGAEKFHDKWYSSSPSKENDDFGEKDFRSTISPASHTKNIENGSSYLVGSWFCISNSKQLKRLMLSLNPYGKRESKLLVSLAKHYKSFEYVSSYIKASPYIPRISSFAMPDEIFSIILQLDKNHGHCGVTFKSIPWFYGGRTFVEIIEPGFQLKDPAKGKTEAKTLQLGDFVISVEGINVENYSTEDIANLIVNKFKVAVDHGKDFVHLSVWRSKKVESYINRPLLISAPRLAYGNTQLLHLLILRCEAFAYSAFHLPAVRNITENWFYLCKSERIWQWPTVRKTWRRRLRSACESGNIYQSKRIGKNDTINV